MGILGDIGKLIIGGALGGPAGAISVFTATHGSDVVEGSIDLAQMIVRVGTDVYRAVPPEVFVAAGDPIGGLLKHVAEDELIMVGQIAGDLALYSGITWPAVGPFGASAHLYVAGRLLAGKVDFRNPNNEEWAMARYIFGDTLPGRRDVVLTNLAGIGGDPFAFPLTPLGHPVAVNLAGFYSPDATTPDGPLLMHEMTHVWQAERRLLREVFLYDALADGSGDEEAYNFDPDEQWNVYNIEQQAAIVEAWALGATRKAASDFDDGARPKLALGSPLFRYINANVRRGDENARTRGGGSVRQLLVEGGHRTVEAMHPKPPPIWW
jgi:hypothetical protein